MDAATYGALLEKISDVKEQVDGLAAGFDYKGSVAAVADLPGSPAAGDMYTVTGANNARYVYDGTQWINLDAELFDLEDELSDLKSEIDVLEPTATSADIGKTLIAKTVADGKVTEYEFGETSAVKPDGYYQGMTVGNAEQLVATVGVEDQVPYNFRTSGGSADIGDREVDKIVGGTIAWNQLMPNPADWEIQATPASIEKNATGCVLTAGNQISAYQPAIKGTAANSSIVDHVYWIYIEFMAPDNVSADNPNLYVSSTGFAPDSITGTSKTGWNIYSKIKKSSAVGYIISYMGLGNASTVLSQGDKLKLRNIKVIDLTQMFGSTIAEYIYSLETANTGAGVAWFRKLFPKPYYAYNAGELMSVQAKSHDMVGFNAWDEEWEVGSIAAGNNIESSASLRSKNYIPVVPESTYCYTCISVGERQAFLFFYDDSKTYISNIAISHYTGWTFVIPSDAHYIRFVAHYYIQDNGTYKNDICINLHWDGERDGEYEAYVKHSYPLDDSLTLRGIPKLDGDNKLYYDGDMYESDGTVNRRYDDVDLGSLTWSSWDESGHKIFYAQISDKVQSRQSICVAPIYTYNPNISVWSDLLNNQMTGSAENRIYIRNDMYSDNATFKTAMSGVYLVYELATPTTEEADPYQNPQVVDDFGTEEYVDAGVTASTPTRDVAIPVGHVTQYQANLRAKLEMAPDSPSGNGDYIVRQTDGQNVYVPITFPADELPAAPTTDGNYVLKCTVSSGTTTYIWEAQT